MELVAATSSDLAVRLLTKKRSKRVQFCGGSTILGLPTQSRAMRTMQGGEDGYGRFRATSLSSIITVGVACKPVFEELERTKWN